MKVLITTEWYAPVINGVVVSVENLAKGLTELGHEVRILTVSPNRRSFTKGKVTYISSVNAARVYPGARVAVTPLRVSRHIRALVRWAPDIIHSQAEFSTFYMARYIAAAVGIPIVHTYHTVYEDYTHYFIPSKRLGRSVVSRLSKRVLNSTACIIVPTEKVKVMLRGYGLTTDIEVIPTGLDFGGGSPPAAGEEKLALRRSLNLPDEHKVLVAIGRLAKEKNLEEIMLFLKKLGQPDLALLIVGDGPRRESLQHYARELGISMQVVFAGMVEHSEIASFYQIGDVFVSASRSETQGLATLEALASGVPSLCRRDPSLDNVIQDGVNGWQYGSFEEFRDRLEGLLRKEGPFRLVADAKGSPGNRSSSYLDFAGRVEAVYNKGRDSFTSARGKGTPRASYFETQSLRKGNRSSLSRFE